MLEGADGVDRVGGARSFQLEGAYCESVIVGRGELGHAEPMDRVDHMGPVLVGRVGRGDEQHLQEIKSFANLFGRPEVAEVDWVKRAAKYPKAHGFPINGHLRCAPDRRQG